MEGIDIITINELCKTINYSGYYLFPDNMEKVLIELILIKFSKANNLHYCWSYFKPCHRLELKIKPNNEFYLEIEESLFSTKQMVFFAIDAMCITENRLILIESRKLFQILKKYYWELDEIYIASIKFDWLISVNHMFEFNFIGDELIKCVKEGILKKQIQSLIIDIMEYR